VLDLSEKLRQHAELSLHLADCAEKSLAPVANMEIDAEDFHRQCEELDREVQDKFGE
jgi:hypothetical protein